MEKFLDIPMKPGGAKVSYKSPPWSGKIIKKMVCSGSFRNIKKVQ